MDTERMKLANTSKLITCILPKGGAMPVLKQLKQELGIVACNINHARGSGRFTPLAHRGVGEQTEKEILSVVVDEAQAEKVFDFIFRAARIDWPHGGLIYQSALSLASQYHIPAELPVER
jgi:nitrogen regulatory protein PII